MTGETIFLSLPAPADPLGVIDQACMVYERKGMERLRRILCKLVSRMQARLRMIISIMEQNASQAEECHLPNKSTLGPPSATVDGVINLHWLLRSCSLGLLVLNRALLGRGLTL